MAPSQPHTKSKVGGHKPGRAVHTPSASSPQTPPSVLQKEKKD
jgi:hypothetical protein